MNRTFLFTCIVYLFAAAIVFPYVRWYADNPDTFQYLDISYKYISGDLQHAVNGYWSPLISWLLAIPLFFFDNELLVFKILQLLIGVFVLFQWSSLLNKTALIESWKNTLIFSSIPFLIDYALLNATPDLLFMGLLFMLINIFISPDIFTGRKTAIKSGITGGLLFLAKAFGFPFFIAFIGIVIYLESGKTKDHKIFFKNVSIAAGIFSLISLFWITTLSIHYNHFTISKAAEFNMSREAAPLPDRSADLPVLGIGLYAPQPHSSSAWESPGEYVGGERITVFNSPSDYLKILRRNLLSIYYFDFRHQTGALFLLLLLLYLYRIGIKGLMKEKWALIILIFILLFYGGYVLVLVHSRYTWINNLLMLLMSAFFIKSVFDKKSLRFVSLFLFGVLLFISLKRPVKEILFSSDSDYHVSWMLFSLKHPFQSLWVFYRPDIKLQNVIDDVKSYKIINGNVASLKTDSLGRDPYTNSLRIARAGNCLYYGQMDNELNILQQETELKKMKINYLITWKNAKWGNRQPVYNNPESGVKIYSLE